MSTIHLTPNLVPPVIRAQYSGQKIQAEICESVHIPCNAGLWDGGSRDTYRALRLSDGAEIPLSDGDAAFHGKQQDQTYTLAAGIVVINHCIFRGKDMGIRIYMHPDNAAPLLPAPSDLPPYGRLVLTLTRDKKSSYQGRDRYAMGAEEMEYCRGIDDTYSRKHIGLGPSLPYPTRAQWDEAKAELIARGLLNKAGAITPAGRNAIG